jgi:rare lipoprotein A (peptidoglycan hydrolase)
MRKLIGTFLLLLLLLLLAPGTLGPVMAPSLHVLAPPPPKHWYGIASWYDCGQPGQCRGTVAANGEVFDARKLTAAGWGWPLGTLIRVVNLSNGRAVVVRVSDRGPKRRLHRLIDLSRAAAHRLRFEGEGLTAVRVELLPQLVK